MGRRGAGFYRGRRPPGEEGRRPRRLCARLTRAKAPPTLGASVAGSRPQPHSDAWDRARATAWRRVARERCVGVATVAPSPTSHPVSEAPGGGGRGERQTPPPRGGRHSLSCGHRLTGEAGPPASPPRSRWQANEALPPCDGRVTSDALCLVAVGGGGGGGGGGRGPGGFRSFFHWRVKAAPLFPGPPRRRGRLWHPLRRFLGMCRPRHAAHGAPPPPRRRQGPAPCWLQRTGGGGPSPGPGWGSVQPKVGAWWTIEPQAPGVAAYPTSA